MPAAFTSADPLEELRRRVLAQQTDPTVSASGFGMPALGSADFANKLNPANPTVPPIDPTVPPITPGPVEKMPMPAPTRPEIPPGSIQPWGSDAPRQPGWIGNAPPVIPKQPWASDTPKAPLPGGGPTKAPRDLTNQRQTMDDWLGFLSQGAGKQFGSGPATRGAGFWGGGDKYRGNLQPVVDAFNAANGMNAKAVGGDKVDFGDGKGPIDVITSGGDWWFGGDAGSNPASPAGQTPPPPGPTQPPVTPPPGPTPQSPASRPLPPGLARTDQALFGGAGGAAPDETLDPTAFNNQFASYLRQLLMQRFGQGGQ